MGSVIDKVKSLFDKVVDVLSGVVNSIWNNIIGPIAEEIFSWLGFEDETIVAAYVSVTPLRGSETYVDPFKKIPINRVFYQTEVYDEIMNIFISGEHVRIRFFIRKIEGYGRTPVNSLGIQNIPYDDLKSIIDAERGESVTILNATVGFPDDFEYIRSYLSLNPDITGYFFDASNRRLWNSTVSYYLDMSDPYVFDTPNNAFDINVDSDITMYIVEETALNVLAAPAATYNAILNAPGTAINKLAAPAATYLVTIAATITVRVDTAIDDHEPVGVEEGGIRVITDTAVDPAVPAAGGGTYELQANSVALTLEELVPIDPDPNKRWEVIYTLDSDTADVKKKYWWYYTVETYDGTELYPQLTPTAPTTPGGAKEVILPIVPLKKDSTWLKDRAKTDPDREEVTRAMRRYGLSLNQISSSLKNDDAGNNADLKSVWFHFGINVATASSFAELDYLYVMLKDYTTFAPDADINTYESYRDDEDFVQLWRTNAVWSRVTKGNDVEYWTLNYTTDTERMIDLLSEFIDPGYRTWYDSGIDDATRDPVLAWELGNTLFASFDDVIGGALNELRQKVKNRSKNNLTSFTISADDYNVTIAYGAAAATSFAGTVGDGTEGNLEKEIIVDGYQLKIRKQTSPGVVGQVWYRDLTGFTYIRRDANNVDYAALDFVGDDVSEDNVANNMVIPITYGYLLELGIVDRKEVLYRAAHITYQTVDVTKLRYYETEAFGNFLGNVLKIVAVVIAIIGTPAFAGVSEILWSAAAIYGSKIIAEYAIQQILLAFPGSKLAIALSVGVAILAAAYGNEDAFATTIDSALTSIAAVSQVTTQYTQIEGQKLIQESQDFLESATEKNERLKQAIDNLDVGNEALLEYIKETITMRFADPSEFYEHRLTRNLVDQALNLDSFTDVQALLETDNLTREIS